MTTENLNSIRLMASLLNDKRVVKIIDAALAGDAAAIAKAEGLLRALRAVR